MLLTILISFFFYLLGSLPTTFLIGKFRYKNDVLQKGSGHSGVSNLYKIASKRTILFILFVDVLLKGFLPSFLIHDFFEQYIFLLLFVIVGHNWSFMIKLKGGKGITVSIGIIMGIDFRLFFFLVITFLILWSFEKFKDSSRPWILSFIFIGIITSLDFIYLEKAFSNLPYQSIFLMFYILLLLLFRRTLGNHLYNSFNRKIIFNRIMFDRDKK